MDLGTYVCSICGNTNCLVNGRTMPCVRCNWATYEQWIGVSAAEAAKSPDWQGFGWICPVCKNYNAGDSPEFDVCPACEWEDDRLQLADPNYSGGANAASLNDYRKWWNERQSQKTA